MVATPRRTRQGAVPGKRSDRSGSKLDTSVHVALITAAATIIAALITAGSVIVANSPSDPPTNRLFPKPSTPAELNSVTPRDTGCSANLLSQPWNLEATGGAAEDWIDFDPPFKPKETDGLEIAYNLHGLNAREGAGRNDSVIVLTQPNWYAVSLATLSTNKNGFNGEQTAYIPLTDFHELPNPQEDIEGNRPLTWGEDVSSIRARFWDFDHFRVAIISIRLCHDR